MCCWGSSQGSLSDGSISLVHLIYSEMLKHYQHVFALIFATQEVNENARLLPNVTLGFQGYDNLFSERSTYEDILDLLFSKPHKVSNYKNDRKEYVLAVIGSLTVETTHQMATILGLYKIPQVHAYLFWYDFLWLFSYHLIEFAFRHPC